MENRAMENNKAFIEIPRGRKGWVVNFRHPVTIDHQNKYGLRIRRGLGTKDSTKAELQLSQINELLSNEDWHSMIKRPEAEARFDSIIVRAFYDTLVESDKIKRELGRARKKRCDLCNKLIGPQGFKAHESACLRRQQIKKLDTFRSSVAEIEIFKKAGTIYKESLAKKSSSFVLVLSKTEGLLTNGKNYTPVKLVHFIKAPDEA